MATPLCICVSFYRSYCGAGNNVHFLRQAARIRCNPTGYSQSSIPDLNRIHLDLVQTWMSTYTWDD